MGEHILCNNPTVIGKIIPFRTPPFDNVTLGGVNKIHFCGKLNSSNYQRSSGTHQERWRDRPDETSATAR